MLWNVCECPRNLLLLYSTAFGSFSILSVFRSPVQRFCARFHHFRVTSSSSQGDNLYTNDKEDGCTCIKEQTEV
ncbi:hypothetical protein HYDPIDRAFT_106192 [Hydnomerulius pinastri MD-312]|nr:hypothetical protein HYDPIDRAFT_106192 [Hydnomerulius pinastri MD-312]